MGGKFTDHSLLNAVEESRDGARQTVTATLVRRADLTRASAARPGLSDIDAAVSSKCKSTRIFSPVLLAIRLD